MKAQLIINNWNHVAKALQPSTVLAIRKLTLCGDPFVLGRVAQISFLVWSDKDRAQLVVPIVPATKRSLCGCDCPARMTSSDPFWHPDLANESEKWVELGQHARHS